VPERVREFVDSVFIASPALSAFSVHLLRPDLSGAQKINFSTVFAGQAVGIKEVLDDIWLVSLWIMIWDTSIWRRALGTA